MGHRRPCFTQSNWSTRTSQPPCDLDGKRGTRGFDGNKKLKGRKRFALCDAGGNSLESVVVAANTGERQGALLLLQKVKSASWSQDLQLVWADEGFAGVEGRRRCKGNLDGSWTSGIKSRVKKASACNANAGS